MSDNRGRSRGGPRGGGGGRGRGQDLATRGPRGGGRSGGGGRGGPRIFSEVQPTPPPNSNVEKTENNVAKELVARKKTAGQPKYPDRPGYGTLGRRVTLYANYLQLTSVGKPLKRYHISIAPEAVGKKARRVVSLLLEQHFKDNVDQIATDYRSTMVSCVELLQRDEASFDVRYKNENAKEYPVGDKLKVYRVTCMKTGNINPADLVNYLTSTNAGAMLESKPEIVQALNLVLGHHPKTESSIVSIGANRHYSINPSIMETRSLGGGLNALRGFFISARAATARVLLNVQVKYLACYEAGSLAQVVGSFQQTNRNSYALDKFLSRLRVRLTHLDRKTSSGKSRPRIKTIAGLANPTDGRGSDIPLKVPKVGAGPHEVAFFCSPGGPGSPKKSPNSESKRKKSKKPGPKAGLVEEGRFVTVEQFFSKEYGITVNRAYPVVNCGTRKDPIYYPLEVCVVPPGQPFGQKLSPTQTSNMLGFAVMRRTPAQNALAITTNGVNMLGLGQQQNRTLTAFGVKVDSNLITVEGRVLSAPKIMYASNKFIEPSGGSWNMRSVRFSKPTQLRSWTWIYFNPRQDRQHWKDPIALNASLKIFADQLRAIGVVMDPPKQGSLLRDLSAASIEKTIVDLQNKHHPSLILGIFYTKETGLYNTVKQICDVRCGVRNVNVLAEKIVNPNLQYSSNVGLKINLKMGGSNQTLRQPDLGFFADGKAMLVGMDVTHPSPGSKSSAPSVAGIVASIDSALSQWPADIRIQPARQEMVADLDNLLRSRIILWAKHNNNNYPENIVVYRDGVSEGQYDTVINNELPQLKKACEALYHASDTKKGLPRMAIVVVGKRHNTRFYPTTEKDAERSANPLPGTVVDRGITESRNWDFYLQAHPALQGTARPAHYFTVWDEIFYQRHPGGAGQSGAADILQDLTHKMCYMFGRATKAVSVCPPAYYADLVCTRARCYLSELFDPTDGPTGTGSVADTEASGPAPDRKQVLVHPNVAQSMFYI